MTRPGSLPSYRWKRPWSMTTGRPAERPRRSRPACPGAVAAGQPGRSANGIATASSRSSARPPRPGAEDDPDLGHEVGPGADRGHEGGEAGGLVGGRDRARGVDRRVSVRGHRGLQHASSVDGRGRRLRPARRKYRHRDADHVPSGRARPGDVVRRQPRLATKRPKRPAAERRSLDVISGPSILSAPSGKTYVTGRCPGRSTRLSTNSRGSGFSTIHELSAAVDRLWRTGRATRPSAAHREHLDPAAGSTSPPSGAPNSGRRGAARSPRSRRQAPRPTPRSAGSPAGRARPTAKRHV